MAEDGVVPPPMPLYSLGRTGEIREEKFHEADLRPPQTGTTFPFIWPPPEHLHSVTTFAEPVLDVPSESLIKREMELDSARWAKMEDTQGDQVYDSLVPPRNRNRKSAAVQGATPPEKMLPWYVPEGPEDDTLVFESRFESGNLRTASKIEESEYNLHLALDINTDRHTQWFYFRVGNTRPGRRYKFNIQNLLKGDSVYNLGMQPLVYSEERAKAERIGWYRGGIDVCYFKNQITRAKAQPFWTLTFTVSTEFPGDTLYLAHCFPYTYTDLQRYLHALDTSPARSFVRQRTLCQTLAGNECNLLTITSPEGSNTSKRGIVVSARQDQDKTKLEQKRGSLGLALLLISFASVPDEEQHTAVFGEYQLSKRLRVHPGETNASWMMKGVMDFLSGSSVQAKVLRENFIFKLVPMLNPDGVIVGNYRCSLAGGDLNRQYENPKRELFPEVLTLKQMAAHFTIGQEVVLYVDLHGHSKKSNIFMYGVENPTDADLYMRERIIPTLLDRASPLFNLHDCSFDVGKGKEGCGRVVTRQQLGIVNSYTMEASFMGANQGQYKGLHFNTGHFESMGHSLCEVILDLCDPEQSKIKELHAELLKQNPIDMSRVVSRQDNPSEKATDSDDDSSLGSFRAFRATTFRTTNCSQKGGASNRGKDGGKGKPLPGPSGSGGSGGSDSEGDSLGSVPDSNMKFKKASGTQTKSVDPVEKATRSHSRGGSDKGRRGQAMAGLGGGGKKPPVSAKPNKRDAGLTAESAAKGETGRAARLLDPVSPASKNKTTGAKHPGGTSRSGGGVDRGDGSTSGRGVQAAAVGEAAGDETARPPSRHPRVTGGAKSRAGGGGKGAKLPPTIKAKRPASSPASHSQSTPRRLSARAPSAPPTVAGGGKGPAPPSKDAVLKNGRGPPKPSGGGGAAHRTSKPKACSPRALIGTVRPRASSAGAGVPRGKSQANTRGRSKTRLGNDKGRHVTSC